MTAMTTLLTSCGNLPEQSRDGTEVQKAIETTDNETTSTDDTASNDTMTADETDNNEITSPGFPNEYKAVIDGIEFDLQLEVPADLDYAKLKRSTAVAQESIRDITVEVLASGKEVAEILSEQEFTHADGRKENMYVVEHTDGSRLFATGNLSYDTLLYSEINLAFNLDGHGTPTSQCFSKEAAFPFMQPDAAFEEVMKTLVRLGYEIPEYSYYYYAVDHQTLNQQDVPQDGVAYLKKQENPDYDGPLTMEYSEAHDVYYFLMFQLHNGIPVYFGSSVFPEQEEDLHPIQAMYSKNGIEHLKLGMLADVLLFQDSDEVVVLKDFEDIAVTVAAKYGSLSADYKVVGAKLYQIPVRNPKGEYDIKIGWQIELEEKDGGNTRARFMLVDAETSEEIIQPERPSSMPPPEDSPEDSSTDSSTDG
jgi:uncharacterized membrane protein